MAILLCESVNSCKKSIKRTLAGDVTENNEAAKFEPPVS